MLGYLVDMFTHFPAKALGHHVEIAPVGKIFCKGLVEEVQNLRRSDLFRRQWGQLQLCWDSRSIQRVEKLGDGQRPFTVAGEVHRLLAQRALRQRGDMAADDDDRLLAHARLDGAAGQPCSVHLLGRSEGLMAEHHHRDQVRRPFGNALRHLVGDQVIGLGVEDVNGMTEVADIAADQPAPQRRFDCRQS